MGGAPARAAVIWIGSATLSGLDRSGLAGVLEDGVTPAAIIGGLSAIAWTGQGDDYLLLPDRGPNFYPYTGGERVDNTQSYINRVQQVKIGVAKEHGSTWHVNASLTGTTLLSSRTPLTGSAAGNPQRRYFTGLSSGIDPQVPTQSMRLDSESLRVGSDAASFFVADEYGPFIHQFELQSGRRLRSIRLPAGFQSLHPAPTVLREVATNVSGRVPNRGMEGLAITPDGKSLVGIMQGPLLQDHAIGPSGGTTTTGTNSRLLRIDLRHCSGGELSTCPSRQYVYQQYGPTTGNSEILAVDDHRFLVIERDGQSGGPATKLVVLIDTQGATDVTDISRLPSNGLPPGVTPVSKRVLLDLAAALQQAGQPVAEKFEGLAFGPDLPDGRHLLLVCVDNDYMKDAPSPIHAFAVDAADLPDFRPQQFKKQPSRARVTQVSSARLRPVN